MIDIEFSEPLESGVYLSEKKNIFQKEKLEKAIEKLTKNLPWIEKMDIIDSEQIYSAQSLSEIEYESQFVDQAKRAVKIGIQMLEENKVLIKRPIDFYAEMLKSDEHMAKIKESVIKEMKNEEMRMQIRQKREEKKFGKDVQREVTQQRQKDKTEFLKEIKKYRKDPNSVDLKANLEVKSKNAEQKKRINKKREFKNKLYSTGGKRSGIKRNTKESTNDISGFNPSKHQNRTKVKDQVKNKYKKTKKNK